ncbi:MAG: hypothetical protein E2590_06385 [Chryseobacterium sp.]|nr:hypothetical protein [Chryseobacterium sp.]
MIYKLITVVLVAFSLQFTQAQELNLFSPNFTIIKSNLETNQIYSQTKDIEKPISIKFDTKNSYIEIDYLDDIPLDY